MAAILAAATARDVQNVNIVSASAITKKIDQCLTILYPDPTSTPTSTDGLPTVSISARSATASKAITIAEILKRRIAEKGGQWYQYTALSSVIIGEKQPQEQPQSKSSEGNQKNKQYKKKKQEEIKKKRKKKDDEIIEDAEGGEEMEEEDPYTVLVEKIPQKKRKVPLLTIYISRSPVLEFKKLHGEQSGGP